MLRRLSTIGVLFCALVVPGLSQGRNGSGVGRISVSDKQDSACQPKRGSAFSLDTLRDLYICVSTDGLAGSEMKVTLILSDGNVYQVMTLPLDSEAGRSRSGGRFGVNGVVTKLPVAGTFITQYNLMGVWSVEVSINGRLIDRENFTLQGARVRDSHEREQ